MQARRPSGLSPLAIVLPSPPIPRRRSSLLSGSSSSPHTPRSSDSPTCPSLFFTTAANRKSTDSWNSSNQDDVEWEWKPEQTLLLSRTLDALPSHLLTPFNGPVPPSNLLDKIARGVSHAKGPEDWPHSIRATRAKLVEISRVRAKETSQDNSKIITEEDDEAYFGGDVLQQTTNTGSRRPLYRQSSMDFINSAKTNLKDNNHLNHLSNRLQRTDRIISNPMYHPYSRPLLHRSPSSNSHPDSFPPSLCLSPSTPSSTTLNSSFSSVPPHPLNTRRSTSTLSNSSDPYLLPSFPAVAEDPRVQRVRRSDPFCSSPYSGNVSRVKGTKQTLKRAPSFGATARDMENNGCSSPYPSSDEEEKVREKKAKKQRTKIKSPATSPPSSPVVLSPVPPNTKLRPKPKASTTCTESTSSSSKSGSGSSTSRSSSNKTVSTAATTVTTKSSPSRPKANLQRNPSIFGAELPHPQTPMKSPSQIRSPVRTHPVNTTPANPTAHPTKTLRRVRATSFARAPARRISFGSLVAPVEEVNADPERAAGVLGSAFQLI